MPYTPPAQQSSDASNSSSPTLSRSHSFLSAQASALSPSSPETSRPHYLPRSTSSSVYLTKHRRSPSASIAPGWNSDDSIRLNHGGRSADSSTYLSRLCDRGLSLPTVDTSLSPNGARVDSSEPKNIASDEDESERGRGRELSNLAELQAAIRKIESRKDGSPTPLDEDFNETTSYSRILSPDSERAGPSYTTSAGSSRPPLSREARKISHSRSSTDSAIGSHPPQPPAIAFSDQSQFDGDEDFVDENVIRRKPPMLRKKSGELVRPALRPAYANRRPSSMPGTPTYSKAVHFDSHLEHVKHFLQVDRPLAVSAGSSPVETFASEIEFPFGMEEPGRTRGEPFRWELRLSNFPGETETRKHRAVRVERVFLSSDGKSLVGVVAVQNLAFNKQVTARFTLDYWKTTSEVTADYNNDVRRKHANDGCDRFNFTIKLSDQANLESKTMFFCIRYDVNGQQFWDNNDSINYQVDFAKQNKGSNQSEIPGLGARPLGALPRCRPSPPLSAGANRPQSMPQSLDDFMTDFDTQASFPKLSPEVISDTPLKLKGPRTRTEIIPDAPARRQKPSGQVFGNRYDFGASLNAAIQNASAILGEQSGLTNKRESGEASEEVSPNSSKPAFAPLSASPVSVANQLAGATSSSTLTNAAIPVKPATLVSEKPSLQSQSYQELVDKYCFFGSARTSPQLTQSAPGRAEDTKSSDAVSVSDVSVDSASSSPSEDMNQHAGEQERCSRSRSPQISSCPSSPPRSGSGLGSRTASPVSFGYPYHQAMNSGLFDAHTAAAIPG